MKQSWLLQDLKSANTCSIGFDGINLVVETPYDRGFVAQLKALIPYADRRWDPDQKAWLVRPDHGPTLQRLCDQFFSEIINLPKTDDAKPEQELRIFEVRYIGVTKDRGDAERSAFGLVDGDWSVLFPESVLRSWFEVDPVAPIHGETLYSVLGARKTSTEGELKSAFRRMARQWHPDISSEPNSHEIFIRINSAYEILSDSKKRAKYDAGLALEESIKSFSKSSSNLITSHIGYRSPLRCGWIMVRGIEVLGRFQVEEILDWQDIVNDKGKILVASWSAGAEEPTEVWI
jgi:hypothetical protein